MKVFMLAWGQDFCEGATVAADSEEEAKQTTGMPPGEVYAEEVTPDHPHYSLYRSYASANDEQGRLP